MKIILETSRLYLREFTLDDAIHFFNLNNDPDVIKYTGNSAFSSVESAKEFLRNYSDYKLNTIGRWAVCLKATNKFLGWCGLKKDLKTEEVDLGFRFYKKYWGNGYATEAAAACVKVGFSTFSIEKIIGRAYTANTASIKVLEKCGLTFVTNFMYDGKPSKLYEVLTNKNDCK